MANLRRTHVLFVAAAIVLIYIIFFSGPETTDFRKVTESSLSSRRGILRGTLSDSELTAQTNQLLQRILDKKNEALIADSGRVDHVPGTASNPKENPKPKWPPVVEKMGDANSNTESPAVVGGTPSKPKPTDDGLERAREELYDIFRKSPIIIFSKSYCPYSKRAKELLLETYTIVPKPYVVELDLMTDPVPVSYEDHITPAPTLGRTLQDLLARLTSRRTVPNIMVNTQSLGGSDDIASMHAKGTLIDEIRKLGGKRIESIAKNHKAED
ncbi:hypothetical protein LTS17_005137 [Exophiala oligosperma]